MKTDFHLQKNRIMFISRFTFLKLEVSQLDLY